VRYNLDKLSFGRKLRLALPWAALALALDLGAKWLVLRELDFMEVRPVTGFFNLVLVENQGAAFSLLSGHGAYQGLKMALLAIVAMVPLVYFLREATRNSVLASLGLIFGGALGNIHDRLRYDAVVDFLDFHFRESHWPAFNLADVAIVLGVAILLWASLGEGRSKKPPKKKVN
jgi:signal peptidase II